MLELHFWPTGNGKKTVILLEEAGVPYTVKPVNIMRGDQFKPDFLRISPNGRMPALVDTEPKGGGAPVTVFESAAIMMYIAEKIGRFWPQELHKKYEVMQWVIWQVANQGPKLGEAGHFRRAAGNPANGDLKYAVTRFGDEAHRLFGVLNLGLHNKRYLAAGEYTIADMICYPWTGNYKMLEIDLDEFPNVKRWFNELSERPALKKAMASGAELMQTNANMSDEERAKMMKVLSNQRAQPVPKEWGASTI
jgi:GSH-dependent disulfide-bond oxidoreductase